MKKRGGINGCIRYSAHYILYIIIVFSSVFVVSSRCQTYRISGKVNAGNEPVKNAQLVFTYTNNSSKQFSTYTDTSGNYFLEILITSAGNTDKPVIPSGIELAQNYPNPFLESTEIKYSLNKESDVTIIIYDILGQEVKRLNSGEKPAGTHGINWDGTNNNNLRVSPGIYLYQLQSGKEVVTKKMIYGTQSSTRSLVPGILRKESLINIGTDLTINVKNTQNAIPQIKDTTITRLLVQSDTTIDFNVNRVTTSRKINIQGYINTVSVPVKFAVVRFINRDNNTEKYIAVTDTSGHFNLELNTTLNELFFIVEIAGNADTEPRIEKKVIEYLQVQNDTSFSFTVNKTELRTYNLYGIVKALSIPVKYAGISFINTIDTLGIFSTVTDTAGHFELTLRAYPEDTVFSAVIENTDRTQPVIVKQEFEDIIINSDTTLDDIIVDEPGPWIKVRPGVNSRLFDIDFADNLNGWAVGDSGMIIHSTDGGESWQKQQCPVDEILFGVDFHDSINGLVCGQYSILKTSDGGTTWEPKHYENVETGHLKEVLFINEFIGLAIGGKGYFGEKGVLLRTTDSGETWTEIPLLQAATLTDISLVDKNDIWICGYNRTILQSTDIGMTWNHVTSGISESNFTAIHFSDRNHGWIGCNDNEPWGFYRTSDRGNTWIKAPRELLSFALGINTVFLADSLTGWIAPILGAGYNAIISTSNGGVTWDLLPNGTNLYSISSFCFLNKNTGWATATEVKNHRPFAVILKYKK